MAGIKAEMASGALELRLDGAWRLDALRDLAQQLASTKLPSAEQLRSRQIEVHGRNLESIDTAGAMLLLDFLHTRGLQESNLAFLDWGEEEQKILELVSSRVSFGEEKSRPKRLNFIQEIGRDSLHVLGTMRDILGFLGWTAIEVGKAFSVRGKFRFKELCTQLDASFVRALPIISLVTFLIGIVIAYLFAQQIVKYGANIFIVDGVSISMCRELSPLIVAIIVAGRSGSAYTAQIGTMKLNDEIDAMQTLGLSPMQVLVVPRVLALSIAMPIMVFVGDVVGIIGGMVIADVQLHVTGATFIERLQTVLTLNHFKVGLIKAPVFAAFIAMIGCRMGLNVERNARSVGLFTTATVVQSLVAVIILNAIFAVIFVELGI